MLYDQRIPGSGHAALDELQDGDDAHSRHSVMTDGLMKVMACGLLFLAIELGDGLPCRALAMAWAARLPVCGRAAVPVAVCSLAARSWFHWSPRARPCRFRAGCL